MAIYRLLKDTAFLPDEISVMATAFEDLCRELKLAERDDPLRDVVARVIICCAEKGERDIIRLKECAHQALHS
jgi:hypothetical protein